MPCGAGFFQAGEFLEDSFFVIGADAWPIVFDPELDCTICLFICSNFDMGGIAAIFYGIADVVYPDFFYPGAIAKARWAIFPVALCRFGFLQAVKTTF